MFEGPDTSNGSSLMEAHSGKKKADKNLKQRKEKDEMEINKICISKY